MSKEAHPLRERLVEGIKQKKAEILEQRIRAVKLVFQILSNNRDVQVWNVDQVLSMSENLTLHIDEGTELSFEYFVHSTRGSLCEQDLAFGTSSAAPKSIAVAIFMVEVPKIFDSSPGFYLQPYAEIDYCPKCGQPIKGEFGFFVRSHQLDNTGFHGANIRVFTEETYPCECKT